MKYPSVTHRLLCCLLLLSTSGLATEQEMRQYAVRLVEEGSRHATAGHYEDALSSFEASMPYEARLTTMWNIAMSHLVLGNGDLAAAYLDRYLQQAPRHRSSLEMQQAVEAISQAGSGLAAEDLRRQLAARLRDADRAARGGTAASAEGSDLRFGVRADTPEARRLSEAARNRGTELFRAGLEASGARDVDRALREFERSLAYRRIRNAVYNISVCHLVLGHRDLADHFLDWYVDSRPEVASDPRVEAVRRAISESPENVGDQNRRLLLWENLYEGVEEPIAFTAGGSRSREVPEHLDRTLAMIEESFHGTVGNNTTCFLMSVARSKSEYLMSPPSPMGPCQRRAVAQSLILVYNELDRRLQAGDTEPTDITGARCIEWDRDDPLRGDLTAVSPFSMLDTWSAIESEEERRCAASSPPAPSRIPTRPTTTRTVSAEYDWGLDECGRHDSPVGGNLVLCGRGVANPPGGRFTCSWRFIGRPSGSTAELTQPVASRDDGCRASFSPDVEGTYAFELVVTHSSGRTNGMRARIATGQSTTERPGVSRDELFRGLFQQTRDNRTFARCPRNPNEPGDDSHSEPSDDTGCEPPSWNEHHPGRSFARWFLANYSTCIDRNPWRVGEPSLWNSDRPDTAQVRTFRGPTSLDLEELREWYDSMVTIDACNEDTIAFFAENRRQLQSTVDYWAAVRRNEQDDSRLSYRNRHEYQDFALIMSSDPPRICLPPGGVP